MKIWIMPPKNTPRMMELRNMKPIKMGIIVFVLLLTVIISVPIVNGNEIISDGGIPGTGSSSTSVISFDGLSNPSTSVYNATELKIPSSITKFELLTFNIPRMREMLANNETITVRINGISYVMELRDSTVKAKGLDPAVRSYRGTLNGSQNSEVGFTIGNRSISGRITIDRISYYFSTTPKTENEKVLQYVYSSRDVIVKSQPTYWADDYLGRNATPRITEVLAITQLPVTTPQPASLSLINSLGVLFFIGLGIFIRR